MTNEPSDFNTDITVERTVETPYGQYVTVPAGYVLVTDGAATHRNGYRLLEAKTLEIQRIKSKGGHPYNYIAFSEDYTTTEQNDSEPAIVGSLFERDRKRIIGSIDDNPEYCYACHIPDANFDVDPFVSTENTSEPLQ